MFDASLLLQENACFWHFTKNISLRRRVIVVATRFLRRLNLILARTLIYGRYLWVHIELFGRQITLFSEVVAAYAYVPILYFRLK
jgi:hypothetical protein